LLEGLGQPVEAALRDFIEPESAFEDQRVGTFGSTTWMKIVALRELRLDVEGLNRGSYHTQDEPRFISRVSRTRPRSRSLRPRGFSETNHGVGNPLIQSG
jgi:hypothetical protein